MSGGDSARRAGAVAGALTLALAAYRARRLPAVWLVRMSGSSIAGPDAAGWVTDFLNAAYYARAPGARDVADLRLANAILTTRWHQLGHRRLRAPDVLAFHGAFGRERVDSRHTPRGTLDGGQLAAGAQRLLGRWFPDAYADDARRAHGIAFETGAEREAFLPEARLRHAKLGPITPPRLDLRDQFWHTYEPVPVLAADSVVAGLSGPDRWPDYASELGRFTALRSGGLLGQTFEIEIFAPLTPRTPAFVRGYVTATTVLSRAEAPDELDAYAAELNDVMVRAGRDEPPVFPEGSTPLLALELTTHEGHFMGRGRNRLLLYEREGQAFLRAAGTWDEMPVSLEQAYRMVGRHAQQAFWGNRRAEASMLHQIAIRTAPT